MAACTKLTLQLELYTSKLLAKCKNEISVLGDQLTRKLKP